MIQKYHKLNSNLAYLRVSGLRVSLDLGRGEDNSEGGEGVVEELLVHLRVEVSDEDVGPNVKVFLVRRGLVHPAIWTGWLGIVVFVTGKT